MPVESINAIVSETAGQGLRLESSEEHLPASIRRGPSTPRHKPSVMRKSARRFAQDDGFVGASTNMRFGVQKHERVKKLAEYRLDLVASSGIEPELSALRGRRVNQLHHDATVD
jgi:hypothetical protein